MKRNKIRFADDAQLIKKRVSFRVDAELANQMRAAAGKEAVPMSLADFTRRLLLWALPHYYRASSLWLLKQATVKVPKVTMPTMSRRAARKPMKTRRAEVGYEKPHKDWL